MPKPRKYINANLPPKEEIQCVFNDAVGEILVYMDEAKLGFTLKQAIRSTIYELCDTQIQPLMDVVLKGQGQGKGQGVKPEDENRFNR